MKKTLQNELKSGASESVNVAANNSNGTSAETKTITATETEQSVNNNVNTPSPIVMDDVNFKYLKHVILKFLTSREVSLFVIQNFRYTIVTYFHCFFLPG